MSNNQELRQNVKVVAYNPNWATLYQTEQRLLKTELGKTFLEIEHIGSTAVPNQHAKPIIDIMVAIKSLDELDSFLPTLNKLNYQLIETDMPERFFLRKTNAQQQVFHLHIVALDNWTDRKERQMRDYLLKHPEAVEAYGDLKHKLALQYPDNSIEYTKAKTEFIQKLIDKARAELGLPKIDVWAD